MKILSGFTNLFHPILLMIAVTILFTDVTSVTSLKPQPQNNKSQPPDAQLPPDVFPKESANDSIPHHLQGELPPLHFPDESTHAVLTDLNSSKSDLSRKDLKKGTQPDGTKTAKPNKTALSNKTTKVASEVPDLLKDYINRTIYEDGTENPLNNDTETVQGPHVVNANKTHEEDVIKSSVEKKSDIVYNESTEKTKPNEKNLSVTDIPLNNTAIEDHADENNNSNVNSSTLITTNDTDTDDTQNSTQSFSVYEEGTESLGNVTTEESTHSKNETEILETKKIENETSTLEYNASIPSTEKTTIMPTSKNDSLDTKDQETADNKTIDKNDTAVPTSTQTSTSSSTNDASTTTVLPSLKTETTTSVNISENLIDHKADMPIALHHADHSHSTSGKSSAFLQPTESAAILAGVFVGIALVGYVGLLIWRRVLEKRYGNREMLVNEDDFYDTNDLRNFEL